MIYSSIKSLELLKYAELNGLVQNRGRWLRILNFLCECGALLHTFFSINSAVYYENKKNQILCPSMKDLFQKSHHFFLLSITDTGILYLMKMFYITFLQISYEKILGQKNIILLKDSIDAFFPWKEQRAG